MFFGLHRYGVEHCVVLGAGLGAWLALRLAVARPRMVDGLVLVNCQAGPASLLERAQHRVNLVLHCLALCLALY